MNASLIDLLSEKESEWIDFKKEFHNNNAKLLHDMLCLSNSFHNGNRYIVFGVANDKTLSSIKTDPNKKTNADLNDFLRQVNLNLIPNVELTFINYEGNELAFLIITNSNQKPFYVCKDFRKGNITVRAGVIYSRLKDTNIPCNETAPNDHIEKMWMQRFGLHQLTATSVEKDFPITLDDPIEKVRNILGEPDATGWQIEHYYSEGFEISYDQHTDLVDGITLCTLPSGTAFEGSFFGIKLGDSFAKVKELLGKPNFWALTNEKNSMVVWNIDEKLLVIKIWSNRSRDSSIPSQQLGTVETISFCNEKSQIGYFVLVAKALEKMQRGEIPTEFEREDILTIGIELDDPVFCETYELLGVAPHSFGGVDTMVVFLPSETVLAFWVYPLHWQYPVIRAITKVDQNIQNDENSN